MSARPMYVLRSIWRRALDDVSGVEAQALEYEATMGRESFERQWIGGAKVRARVLRRLRESK